MWWRKKTHWLTPVLGRCTFIWAWWKWSLTADGLANVSSLSFFKSQQIFYWLLVDLWGCTNRVKLLGVSQRVVETTGTNMYRMTSDTNLAVLFFLTWTQFIFCHFLKALFQQYAYCWKQPENNTVIVNDCFTVFYRKYWNKNWNLNPEKLFHFHHNWNTLHTPKLWILFSIHFKFVFINTWLGCICHYISSWE